jgi:hypothetical protein
MSKITVDDLILCQISIGSKSVFISINFQSGIHLSSTYSVLGSEWPDHVSSQGSCLWNFMETVMYNKVIGNEWISGWRQFLGTISYYKTHCMISFVNTDGSGEDFFLIRKHKDQPKVMYTFWKGYNNILATCSIQT